MTHDPFTCRVCQRVAEHLALAHMPDDEDCAVADRHARLHLAAPPGEQAGHDRELRAAEGR